MIPVGGGLKQHLRECLNKEGDFLAGEGESEISQAARKERGWKILPQNCIWAPTKIIHQWQNFIIGC